MLSLLDGHNLFLNLCLRPIHTVLNLCTPFRGCKTIMLKYPIEVRQFYWVLQHHYFTTLRCLLRTGEVEKLRRFSTVWIGRKHKFRKRLWPSSNIGKFLKEAFFFLEPKKPFWTKMVWARCNCRMVTRVCAFESLLPGNTFTYP